MKRLLYPAAVIVTHHVLVLTWCRVHADSPKQYIELAGTLVCSLWKECPSLVTEFVDDGHLPSLLERVANFRGLREGTVLIMLVLIVLKYTDALATEPLLLKAITKLVTACQDLVASPVHPVFEPDRKNALDLQVCF